MKIARFEWGGAIRHGIVEGDTLFSLVGDLFGDFSRGEPLCSLSEARILPPVVPSKVVGVGRNYAACIADLGEKIPEEPSIFMKPVSAVVGPLEPVIYPKMSSRVIPEAELAIVIGKLAKDVTRAEAGHCILGYTCGNDVTALDLFFKGHGGRSKCFDTFCPLGPYIVTELDAANLRIECRVNGQLTQQGSTGLMLYGVEDLVSFISQIMTLLPGDVIMSGTPGGLDSVEVGDVMEVEIEGIGILQNPIGR